MNPLLTDAEILAESIRRSDAFESIFERHYDLVFRYVSRRVGRNDAADIASEVFVVAFKARHKFDAAISASAKPWLLGIATNLVRRRARSAARRFRALARSTPPSHVELGDEVEDRLDAERAVDSLNRALGALSTADRETFLLYSLSDATYEDVAMALAIPIGTVRSRISRARSRLANHLEGDGQYRWGGSV